jgi:hypothetical protein
VSDLGDCRHCRSWKGCPGQWYADREANQTEWYSHQQIRWCPRQVFWILKWADIFDSGEWPKPPRSLECDAKKVTLVAEARFCRPKRIIGEVRARLARCKDKGRILERDAKLLPNMTYLEKDIKSVLYYTSGWRRRATPFRVWNSQRN